MVTVDEAGIFYRPQSCMRGKRVYSFYGALGMKYRLLIDGSILEKKTGKFLAYVEDSIDVQEALAMRSRQLDKFLEKYVKLYA